MRSPRKLLALATVAVGLATGMLVADVAGVGPAGAVGVQGVQGPVGLAGAQGESSQVVGPRGPQGPAGAAGLVGDPGPQGAAYVPFHATYSGSGIQAVRFAAPLKADLTYKLTYMYTGYALIVHGVNAAADPDHWVNVLDFSDGVKSGSAIITASSAFGLSTDNDPGNWTITIDEF
jgi:hypothetical protein